MPITITDVQGLPEQLQRLSELQHTLERAVKQANQQPNRWVLLTEANKRFIGRNNKPMHRNSFRKLVDRLIADKVLVEGKNLLTTGGQQFISTTFLDGADMPKPKKQNTGLELVRLQVPWKGGERFEFIEKTNYQ